MADNGWIDRDFIAASTLAAAQGPALISRPGGGSVDTADPLADFTAAVAANHTTIDDGGAHHRPEARGHRQGGTVDRRAEGWRKARSPPAMSAGRAAARRLSFKSAEYRT
ncbi:hypothetical protein CCR97_14900 [Rhodoplanes elegans]|uniref:Uncharacterized protein n=1 Tax=Rhodoplanes elegans TaxID=29408 RepID=A0A327L159_9BRAD|nr:hypothetical protein [Rhodoplanes elegans]MBK5959486.1 hypothetical protein [Rhodoplanes elegans]RAI41408.1 hypothetical protein CH338_03305 [Rhodoplanes elegans]